jgi:putative phosphoribosyl transferase
MPAERIHDLPPLRDRGHVFRDRTHAGQILAGMLTPWPARDAIVLAIPSGGVPVAAEIARQLDLTLDVAVVSKILLPWTTEAGFGAVAFDGTVWVDEEAVEQFGLAEKDIERRTNDALAKVRRRLATLRGDRPFPQLASRTAILVDDGIAAGSTMRVAIAALRRHGTGEIVVAVPTGHARSVESIALLADAVYCANVRSGHGFAVADAYESWYDVPEQEVEKIMQELAAARVPKPAG